MLSRVGGALRALRLIVFVRGLLRVGGALRALRLIVFVRVLLRSGERCAPPAAVRCSARKLAARSLPRRPPANVLPHLFGVRSAGHLRAPLGTALAVPL